MLKNYITGIEAILFDFEGTLVDFQWNLTGAVHETLEMLKTSGFPTDRLQNLKYSTLMREAVKMAPEIGQPSDEVKNKISAIYDRYDEDALSRWSLRPQAREFLYAIQTKEVKVGLVSNVGKKGLERALSKLNLENIFRAVVTRNDVQTLKPSGEGIRLALDWLQVKQEKAIFIGDSLDDIYASQEAGLKVLVILGGENPKEKLLAANPDILIQGFDELLVNLS
jgi:phosphoglycolate phosphatase